MSDYYSIQDVGGTELARHYPDRGLIADVEWHRAILIVAKEAKRFWGLFGKSERFIGLLSANSEGLRIFVSLDKFAIFMPWAELSVAAERSTPATVMRLRTAAVPSVSLEMHLDDKAADEFLLRGAMTPLPRRDPPCRLSWPRPWAVAVLLVVMLAFAGVLGSLRLSGPVFIGATVAASVAMWVLWITCKRFIEEEP